MSFRVFIKKRLCVLTVAAVLVIAMAGCNQTPVPQLFVTESSVDGTPSLKPSRIVSLDFCSDQYVLKLSDRDNIVALSPDAQKPFSYLREKAVGLPTVRPNLESILALQPDLVVRSYGGGPNISQLLSRLGMPVLNVGWAGDVEGIKRVTIEMAAGLGVMSRGEALVAEMESRIAELPLDATEETALYMTPSGTTTGAGSLVNNLLETAGLRNFEPEPGWRSLPLERMVYQAPDLVAAAFFNTHGNNPNSWSAMRHPVARSQLSELPSVHLDGAWMSCGAWFAVDAIEALSRR